MTVSTTISIKQYDGDGSTTSFPTVFRFIANEDVRVTLKDAAGVETVWDENTHYTLTGAGQDGGGTVSVIVSPMDYTPQEGETLVIERTTKKTQETDYPEGGAFPAIAHENALDKLTMLMQEMSDRLSRTLDFPVSDPIALSARLPGVDKRSSMFLAFDSGGEPIAAAGTSANLGPVSAFIDTLLDDADAATARATLGLVIGTDVQAYDADTLKRDVSAILTAGFPVAQHDYGEIADAGTLTVDLSQGSFAKASLPDAGSSSHTIAPDATRHGAQSILLESGTGGSYSLTTSGWDKVIGTFDGAASKKHRLICSHHDDWDELHIIQEN